MKSNKKYQPEDAPDMQTEEGIEKVVDYAVRHGKRVNLKDLIQRSKSKSPERKRKAK